MLYELALYELHNITSDMEGARGGKDPASSPCVVSARHASSCRSTFEVGGREVETCEKNNFEKGKSRWAGVEEA
jgi:hypothetical protein